MGGIKQHRQGIQITFYWNGERYRPTLKIPFTPSNKKYAERLKGEIELSIAKGEYNLEQYAKHFPTSKIAKSIPKQLNSIPTFKELSDTWLLSISDYAAGTIANYKKCLNFWLDHLGEKPITEIPYSTLIALTNSQGWNPKHRNNMLIPVRRVFDMATNDSLIEKNPASLIKNTKVQSPPPDPFTLDEVNAITGYMLKNFDEQVYNYYEYAFFSGVRPEEEIALMWPEIDFNHELSRIRRVRTAKTDRESTKTSVVRDIELNSRALAAIIRQKKFTFMKSEYVFHNPVIGKQWNSEASQRRIYWNPTLKALGIRQRVQYQTRHTFATLNLMAGANPMWVARMLGHKTMQMVLNVYSKWIDGADKKKEINKIEAFFSEHSHHHATKIAKQNVSY
jgi:integrase